MRTESVEHWPPPEESAARGDDGCLSCRRSRWSGSRAHGECPALLILDSDGATIGDARRDAARYAAACCPWADPDDIELIVSELCTNAFRHATGWWRLRLHAHTDQLVLDVDDACPALPRQKEPDLVHGTGGLGMHLVEQLAAKCEFLPHAEGKTVRVIMACGFAP
ncbi:ATP-binding protein [Streptomyces sp. NPDC005573]|uniref:ATP-binding protein n=1 Tax=unclassified Streptomyces TaxID=2593676 RepID=UPI0033B84A90